MKMRMASQDEVSLLGMQNEARYTLWLNICNFYLFVNIYVILG